MWNVGCQVVALNYQTPCDEMSLNLGKFWDNGGCGYLLKPHLLCDPESGYNPLVPVSLPSDDKVLLHLEVISGQQLPKPNHMSFEKARGEIIDPYVSVTIHGVPQDRMECRTSTVQNNGFNPEWNQTMEFDIACPDLAVVHFRVFDADLGSDDFVAQSVIPLKSLQKGGTRFAGILSRPDGHLFFLSACHPHLTPIAPFSNAGYRRVQLYNRIGSKIPKASLFIRANVGGQSRSLSRKKSSGLRPLTKPRHGTTAGPALQAAHVKTGIPEMDSAWADAPRAEIEDLQEDVLVAIEHLKDVLGVDNLCPIRNTVAELGSLVTTHHGTLQAEVGEREGRCKTTGVCRWALSSHALPVPPLF
jgi:hypothetical protein